MNESQDTTEDPTTFWSIEYSALREEIIKRTDIQQQLFLGALIATGTFLTLGTTNGSKTALLTYPILALCLAIAWVQNDIHIGRLGRYIRDNIEQRFLGDRYKGWEDYFAEHPEEIPGFGSLSHLATRGVLIGTQLFTMLISLPWTDCLLQDVVLLVLDGVSVAFTIYLLCFQRTRSG